MVENYSLINWLSELCDLCNIKINYFRTKEESETFFAIPSCKNAKLILPLQNGLKGYWRGLDLYPTISPRLAVKKSLMRIAGFGSLFLKERRIIFSGQGSGNPAQSLYELLSINSREVDQIRSFAVRKGSAGVGFKLIFQFQGENAQVVSYIKAVDPIYRRELLLNEKQVLEYLNSGCYEFIVPTIIGWKERESFSTLELSTIQNIKYYPHPSPRKVALVLGSLCKNTAIVTKATAYEREETRRLLNLYLKNEKTHQLVEDSLDYLSSTSFPRPLSHRDLAGWNLFSCENDKIGILDWEFAKTNHLPFQDLYHYFLHTTIHNTNLSPIESYKKVLQRSAKVQEAIKVYAEITGIRDSKLIYHLKIAYLWDWYTLEKSRAETGSPQGGEYLEILNWLAENENRN